MSIHNKILQNPTDITFTENLRFEIISNEILTVRMGNVYIVIKIRMSRACDFI